MAVLFLQVVEVVPGLAGGVLDDPDEQKGEPAEQDLGANAVLEPVIDRPQLQVGLHVAPAPLDFQELLVAQGDVLGGQVRVAAAQEILAVQVGFGFDLGLVDAELAAGSESQIAVRRGSSSLCQSPCLTLLHIKRTRSSHGRVAPERCRSGPPQHRACNSSLHTAQANLKGDSGREKCLGCRAAVAVSAAGVLAGCRSACRPVGWVSARSPIG